MLELIDKDYIKIMLLAWGKELSENPNAESDIQIDMIRQFYNSVSDLQTIKAEPVRHGRWIRKETSGGGVYSACSECDAMMSLPWYWFCGKCGTQMDVDETEMQRAELEVDGNDR